MPLRRGGREAAEAEAEAQSRIAALEQQERYFRALVQNSADVITVIDAQGVIRYQSASAQRVLGYPMGALVGRQMAELFSDEARNPLMTALLSAPVPPSAPLVFESHLRSRDGSWVLTETTAANLLAHDPVYGIVLTSRDVGQRRQLEEELRRQALHDPLTGLGNRMLFTDRLAHAVSGAKRTGERVAVLLVDLDGFKQVNDTLGHAAGDTLLQDVARRLLETVREGDTVCRMGGDEFAVLLERTDQETPRVIGQRVLNRLRAPVELESRRIFVQGSIGLAAAFASTSTAEALLHNADLAMYEAKGQGKGTLVEYKPGMRTVARQRVELDTDLRRAISDGQLLLHYQPVVALDSGRMSGAEALIRWNHPDKGMVQPMEFLPVAEESDLGLTIGRWVLNEACRRTVELQQVNKSSYPFVMAVNISAGQLVSPWIVNQVEEALTDSGCDPSWLVLEIVESGLLTEENDNVIDRLTLLKALGVGMAIDDFGTGWSSLSRLRSFPVDKLKIDKSFVSEISSPDDEAPLIAAIMAMARSLTLRVVAEGVETTDQLACLNRHGCDEVQGFLLGRPVPLATLIEQMGTDVKALMGGVKVPASPQERELIEAIADAAKPVESQDVQEVALHALVQLQRTTDADAVYLTSIDWDRMVEVVACSAPGSPIGEGDKLPWFDSPASRMVGGGSPYEPDLRNRAPGHMLVRQYGMGSIVVVGLGDGGRAVGTLCAASKRPGAFTSQQVALVEMFARLLADGRTAGPEDFRAVGAAPL